MSGSKLAQVLRVQAFRGSFLYSGLFLMRTLFDDVNAVSSHVGA